MMELLEGDGDKRCLLAPESLKARLRHCLCDFECWSWYCRGQNRTAERQPSINRSIHLPTDTHPHIKQQLETLMPKKLAKGKHLLILKLHPGPIPLVEQPPHGSGSYAAPGLEKVRFCLLLMIGERWCVLMFFGGSKEREIEAAALIHDPEPE